MKRFAKVIAACAFVLGVLGCAQMGGSAGWVTLIDGEKGLENFNRVGDANWRTESGAIVADRAKVTSFLVTKQSYGDFRIRVEFWAEDTTNSGIFMRIQDPQTITDKSAYEANIFDQRPDQTYATGGIVNFAPVLSPVKAGGKWNTFDITARGPNIVVTLNGVRTAELNHNAFTRGPIALQFGNRGKEPGGAIKWRKVQIQEL